MKHSFATAPSAALLLAAGLMLGGCERPPVDTAQIGYRGVAMETVSNPRLVAAKRAENVIPTPVAAVPEGGPPASAVYKNVQVLGDLSVGEFSRTMVAITEWVAPKDQSCSYCHKGADLANDDTYTKVVARRMLQMTRDINTRWDKHVAKTGVTCFTCHRGNAVPQNIWFKDPGPEHASMMAGNRAGQNAPSPVVGLSSLPNDPFTPFLGSSNAIRVVSTSALPGKDGASIKQAEVTYGLMMHMSQALGVNCTYCHNSRSFMDWSSSTPQRAVAWYGIRMVENLNANYLEPLKPQFPANRLGPTGDVPKINCTTCHQGIFKPLYGESMLKDYPALAHQTVAAAAPPADAAATAAPATATPVTP